MPKTGCPLMKTNICQYSLKSKSTKKECILIYLLHPVQISKELLGKQRCGNGLAGNEKSITNENKPLRPLLCSYLLADSTFYSEFYWLHLNILIGKLPASLNVTLPDRGILNTPCLRSWCYVLSDILFSEDLVIRNCATFHA